MPEKFCIGTTARYDGFSLFDGLIQFFVRMTEELRIFAASPETGVTESDKREAITNKITADEAFN